MTEPAFKKWLPAIAGLAVTCGVIAFSVAKKGVSPGDGSLKVGSTDPSCRSFLDVAEMRVTPRILKQFQTARVTLPDVLIPGREDAEKMNQMGVLAIRVITWQPENAVIESVKVLHEGNRLDELPAIFPQSRPEVVAGSESPGVTMGRFRSDAFYFIPLHLLPKPGKVLIKYAGTQEPGSMELGERFARNKDLAHVDKEDPRKLPNPDRVIDLMNRRYCLN